MLLVYVHILCLCRSIRRKWQVHSHSCLGQCCIPSSLSPAPLPCAASADGSSSTVALLLGCVSLGVEGASNSSPGDRRTPPFPDIGCTPYQLLQCVLSAAECWLRRVLCLLELGFGVEEGETPRAAHAERAIDELTTFRAYIEYPIPCGEATALAQQAGERPAKQEVGDGKTFRMGERMFDGVERKF